MPDPVPPRLGRELRATALLALPLILGHVSTGLISFVDNVIAGHHGTLTLASVTVGTALLYLPMMVPLGTLIALTASVSQLDGAGRREQIGPLFRQALWLSLGLGLVMFAFLSAAPRLLEGFGIAADIIPGATAFCHAVRWGAPALVLGFCMRYVSEGMHWTLPTMVFGFGALVVLAPLGYALAFGVGPLPEMGAAGLGTASAAVMWLQTLGFATYLWRSRRFAPLALFSHLERPRWAPIRGLLATGLPIGVTVLMEGGLFIATALLIARLGEVPAAAHQIAINVAALCFMVPMGLADRPRCGSAAPWVRTIPVACAGPCVPAIRWSCSPRPVRPSPCCWAMTRWWRSTPATWRWRRWPRPCCCTRPRSSFPTASR